MAGKRVPLSEMIAAKTKGYKSGDDSEKATVSGPDEQDDDPKSSGGKYEDDGMISAAEDMMDAHKGRDAKALNKALCHWMEMHGGGKD